MQEILQMACVFDGSLLKSFKQKWQDIHKKTKTNPKNYGVTWKENKDI